MASNEIPSQNSLETETAAQSSEPTTAKDAASFASDSFARIHRLSKIELISIIASATIPGIAHGACACGY